MENNTITFKRKVEKEEEKQYVTIPFSVADHVDRMEISYEYDRSVSIIDFGLMNEDGEFLGWSGSDRSSIFLSEWGSAAGFPSVAVGPGEWNIILGAYRVQAEGVAVTYHVNFLMKRLQLLKGDTHLHSCGSDGNLTPAELCFAGEKAGLDYLIITDHNNYAHNEELHTTNQVTMIPGVEWTHYNGHAGLLGVKRPLKNVISNTLNETKEKLEEAGSNGALTVLNHPFCPYCGWKWGIEHVNYDLIELWNGSLMIESNLTCLRWWDSELKKGKQIPVTGGSDFHRYEPGRMPASPCTCVYAMSRSGTDILSALRRGHSFITISPEGPMVKAIAKEYPMGDKHLMGDVIPKDSEITFEFWNLKQGDLIYLIHEGGTEKIECGSVTNLRFTRTMPDCFYYRAEVRRKILPDCCKNQKPVPILLTNPFYIEDEHHVRKTID